MGQIKKAKKQFPIPSFLVNQFSLFQQGAADFCLYILRNQILQTLEALKNFCSRPKRLKSLTYKYTFKNQTLDQLFKKIRVVLHLPQDILTLTLIDKAAQNQFPKICLT